MWLGYTLAAELQPPLASDANLSAGGVVSVQVLNELASVARRKLGMPWNQVTEALGAIRSLCSAPAPITIEMHEAALRIATEYGYHLYDALIVAAALEAGCSTLYSEDLRDGQVIAGRLTVRNPFAKEAAGP